MIGSTTVPLVLRLLWGCALAIGVVALSFAVHVPASVAGTYKHVDARHDVDAFIKGDDHRARHNRQSDVAHLRIVHNEKDVRLYVRFRSGRMHGVEFRTFRVGLTTPGHDYTAGFIWNRGGDQQDDLLDETTGKSVNCDQTIARNNHTYLLRINRTCLHRPLWVRAAVQTGTYLGANDSRSDNALSDNWDLNHPGLIDRPFSPRVHSSI
jgi:hypothetical protein